MSTLNRSISTPAETTDADVDADDKIPGSSDTEEDSQGMRDVDNVFWIPTLMSIQFHPWSFPRNLCS